jgi:hypothetical protein
MAVLIEDADIGSVCGYLVAEGWDIVSRAALNQRCTNLAAAGARIRKGPRKVTPQCGRLDHGPGDRLPAGPMRWSSLLRSGTLGRRRHDG